MKFRFARLICVAMLWLSFTVADAQPFRHLTVDDFRGIPYSSAGEAIAYTYCSIAYTYVAHKEKNYYVLDFNILLLMDNNKSWLARSGVSSPDLLAEILKHEQGHYNIAYLEQQELLRTISRTVFYADYQNVAQNIFNRIDAKYQQLNLNYDEDTQHMLNRIQQHSWDTYFKKQLGFEYLANN